MNCIYCGEALASNDAATEHAGTCPVMNGDPPDSDEQTIFCGACNRDTAHENRLVGGEDGIDGQGWACLECGACSDGEGGDVRNQLANALAALSELAFRNPLRNDRDAYMNNLALWGLGLYERPSPADFGMSPADDRDISSWIGCIKDGDEL